MKTPFSIQQPFHPSLITDFVQFVRQPSYRLHPGEGISLWRKIWTVLRTWSASTLVIGMIAIGIGIILNATGTQETEHTLSDFLLNGSPLIALVFATVIAPIQEEFSFRLWLLPRRNTIAFGLSAFLWFFLIPALAPSIPPIDHILTNYDIILVTLSGWIVFGVIASFIIKVSQSLSKIQRFFQSNYRLIIPVSALAFSVAHLINYPEILSIWYLAPILILPQFIIGYPLAYIRVKLGLFWSIVYHALHNAFLLLPLVIIRLLGIPDPTTLTPELIEQIPAETLTSISLISLIYIGVSLIGTLLVIQLLLEYYRHRATI